LFHFAVHQDATGQARDRAMAATKGIGGTCGGILETSFGRNETDLFASKLCCGV